MKKDTGNTDKTFWNSSSRNHPPLKRAKWAIQDDLNRSAKHLAFQTRLKDTIKVLQKNAGATPEGAAEEDCRWFETVRQIMLELDSEEIIGSGCLNDDQVIELLLQGPMDHGQQTNIFLRMHSSDVRYLATLRHMGDIDMPTNLYVPILPFPLGFS